MLRMLWVGMVVLGMAGTGFAQFNAILYYVCDPIPLTINCDGTGGPIPDGASVEIFWDADNDGPDADDQQPVVGNGFGECNFNAFPMNGLDLFGCEGGFGTDPAFTISTVTPQPSRYWLRICVPGQARQWRTNSFTIADGLADYDLAGLFNCVEEACGGCLTPPGVGGLTATSNSCADVTLNWNPYPAEPDVNTLRIRRDGVRIAVVPRTQTSFIDSNAPAGTSNYELIAARDCGPGDTAVAAAAVAFGTRIPIPVAPHDSSVVVSATPGVCSSINIRWRTPQSTATFDSFGVFQNDIVIRRVGPGTAGNPVTHTILTPLSGPQNYSIKGWSEECGYGPPTSNFPGTAFQQPAQVSGVTATQDSCNSTRISWTAVPLATSYIVRRNGTQIGTTVVPGVSFFDNSGSIGVTFQYTVAAVISTNPAACQEGAQSASANGSRISTPTAPTSVLASDSTICSHVLVTWTDNSTNETGFIIRRGGTNIDTVGAGVTSYNDSSGATAPATSSYQIAALNACGASAFATANVGSKKPLPPQVTGLTATNNLSDRVTLNWTNVIRETGYRIYRDAVLFDSVGANVTTYNDFTVLPGRPYYYQIEAFNECGQGGLSEVAEGVNPCQRSLQIQGLVASTGECDLTLVWEDDDFEDQYIVYRDGEFRASVAANETTFVDDQAQGNTNYEYQVAGANECIEGPPSDASIGFRYIPPQYPTGVNATDSLCTEIVVTWNDVSFEDGYIVRRNGLVVGFTAPDVTQYTDPIGSGSFSYRVQAFNPCGASFNSLADSGHTDIAPTMLMLTTSSPDCEGITLSYSATMNTDTVRLYRNDVLIAEQIGGIGNFEDLPPLPGDYSYSAQAIGDCGVSNVIDSVSGSLLEYPAGPTGLAAAHDSCDTIFLSWLPASGDFGYYRVLRDGFELAVLPNSSTGYDDATVIGGIEYGYSVMAINDTCGVSQSYDSLVTSLVLGSLPAAPEVVIVIENLDAVLTWSPVDTTIAGCPVQVSRYLVYFSENTEGPFYYHGSTTDTTYRHLEVVEFAADMYYQVETYVGDVGAIAAIPEGSGWTKSEIQSFLTKETHENKIHSQHYR